jgi:D-alanyl-D-alanine carboxypeptidase
VTFGPRGPSSHWLGTVIAVSDAPDRDAVAIKAEPSETARWLALHAREYGFIPATPESAQGYSLGYEPWRLRWVGREMAARLPDPQTVPDYGATVTEALRRALAELSQP